MILSSEPVVTAGAIAGLVGALLVLLVAFGVPLDETQRNAILAVVIAAVPIVAAVWARSKVTPTGK